MCYGACPRDRGLPYSRSKHFPLQHVVHNVWYVETALDFARKNGRLRVDHEENHARLIFLGHELNIEKYRKECWAPPLLAAIQAGQLAIAKMLLAAGADPNQQNGWEDGITDHFTPLMAACSHDDLALVEALIAAGAKVNYDEALIGGALIGGAHRALIAAGANVNAEMAEWRYRLG